jgi:hypothetical protein
LVRNLKGLTCVADLDHAALAEKINRVIRDAVAFRDREQQRPANHEVLDFLHNVETEATTLLRRFGLLDQFDPFPAGPPVPDHNADWFVHMRQGLGVSRALPWWLFSGNIGGLRLSDRATRRVEHARRGPRLYRDEAPTVAEELRFATVAAAREMIQAAPIILALRGPSVTWIVRVLRVAAKRSEARDDPGGADLRQLAQMSAETLAKHLQTARTGIRRAAPNSSAGIE